MFGFDVGELVGNCEVEVRSWFKDLFFLFWCVKLFVVSVVVVWMDLLLRLVSLGRECVSLGKLRSVLFFFKVKVVVLRNNKYFIVKDMIRIGK